MTATPPTTPLQRATFLDVCVNWLVHEPSDPVSYKELRNVPFDDGTDSASSMVYTDADLQVLTTRQCSVCGTETSRVLLANPFSQRCHLLFCGHC